MSDERYESVPLASPPQTVYDRYEGKYDESGINAKAKTITFRHAQKEAMRRGDADTYFMRKSSKKKARKSGSK